jgi:hypothetical protein
MSRVDIFIKLLISLITFGSIMILVFTIFRIPIKANDKQIAILALVVGTTNFYFKFVVDSPYFLLEQIVVWIVLLTILRSYSIFFSVIVCITGAIFVTIIETTVTLSAIGLKLSTMEQINNNSTHYIALHLAVTVAYLFISFFLAKFKVGFSFVRARFAGNPALKTYNFVWAAVLIFAVTTIQMFANSYTAKSYNIYLIIIMSILMFVALYNAFVKNKESIKDRYGKEGGGTNKPG